MFRSWHLCLFPVRNRASSACGDWCGLWGERFLPCCQPCDKFGKAPSLTCARLCCWHQAKEAQGGGVGGEVGTDHALPLSELSEEGADEVVLGISVAELLDNTMECSGRKM